MLNVSLELFADEVVECVKEILGDGYDIELRRVPKNNGIILTGISICRAGEKVSPVIYLDDYYAERADTETEVELTARKIVNCFRYNGDLSDTVLKSAEHLYDFGKARDRVMLKLIHTKNNEQRLNQVPNIPYLDLSIVFYLYMDEDSGSMMTAQIQNEHLALWGVDTQMLYRIALQNMQRVMPAQINSITQIIEDLKCAFGEEPDEDRGEEDAPFYVLTTSSGINGAACMLYSGVLEKFAEQRGNDIIILPSSVHEVFLLEDTGEIDYMALTELVKCINATEVPTQDILSEKVYRYERCSGKVVIAV